MLYNLIIFCCLFINYHLCGQYIKQLPFAPDYSVNTIAETKDFIYLGGYFNSWYEFQSYVYLHDSETNTPMEKPFEPNNKVHRILADEAQNAWFIVGDFTQINHLKRIHIARLHEDFSLDTTWVTQTPLSFIPNHVFLYGTYLYCSNDSEIALINTKTKETFPILLPKLNEEMMYKVLSSYWKVLSENNSENYTNGTGLIFDISYLGHTSTELFFSRIYRNSIENIGLNAYRTKINFYTEIYTYTPSTQHLKSLMAFTAQDATDIFLQDSNLYLHHNGYLNKFKCFNIKTLEQDTILSSFLSKHNIVRSIAPENNHWIGYLPINYIGRFVQLDSTKTKLDTFLYDFNNHTLHLTIKKYHNNYYLSETEIRHSNFNIYKGNAEQKLDSLQYFNSDYTPDDWAINQKGQLLLLKPIFPKKVIPISNLARLHKATWTLDTTWNPNINCEVLNILSANNQLFINLDCDSFNSTLYLNNPNNTTQYPQPIPNVPSEYELAIQDRNYIYLKTNDYESLPLPNAIDIKSKKIIPLAIFQTNEEEEDNDVPKALKLWVANNKLFLFVLASDSLHLYKLKYQQLHQAITELKRPIWSYYLGANRQSELVADKDILVSELPNGAFEWHFYVSKNVYSDEQQPQYFSYHPNTQKIIKEKNKTIKNQYLRGNFAQHHSLIEFAPTHQEREFFLFTPTNNSESISFWETSEGILLDIENTNLDEFNGEKITTTWIWVDKNIPHFTELSSDIKLNFGQNAKVLLSKQQDALYIANMLGFVEASVALLNSKKEILWTENFKPNTLFYKYLGKLPIGTYTIEVKIKSYMLGEQPHIYKHLFIKK